MAMNPIVCDLETVAIDSAAEYMEAPEAPANYKDESKIAAYIKEATDKSLGKCALDPDLCRIVALGWLRVGVDLEPRVLVCRDEHEERSTLAAFWRDVRRPVGGGVNQLVTFNGNRFDLPVLMRRSQYLNVDHPFLNIDRYRTPHLDLWQKLSFNGAISAHGLQFYAKRFGLPVESDPIKGSHIPALVREGSEASWGGIKSHCALDVKTTHALATRLGYIETTEDDPEMVA
jgi:hypothetical protein